MRFWLSACFALPALGSPAVPDVRFSLFSGRLLDRRQCESDHTAHKKQPSFGARWNTSGNGTCTNAVPTSPFQKSRRGYFGFLRVVPANQRSKLIQPIRVFLLLADWHPTAFGRWGFFQQNRRQTTSAISCRVLGVYLSFRFLVACEHGGAKSPAAQWTSDAMKKHPRSKSAPASETFRKAHPAVWLTALALGIGLAAPGDSLAQGTTPSTTPPPVASSTQALLSEGQLDQLLAPIALYPDPLLSEVLMAATYPLEVVEAQRWVTQNKSMQGNALKDAVAKQTWDDSVKSLTAVPDVLSMMSTKLDWTQKLGDAVLAQQNDVMDSVQRLRQHAQSNGKLNTTKEQTVSVSKQADKQYIAIAPAQPETIYVPYYDPAVVYGAWTYPDYPPYYFTPPGYIATAAVATGVAFASGVAVGAWAANNNWWGGGFNWGGNNIYVRNTNIINTNNNWIHNPDHRHGVRYTNANVQQKFSRNTIGNANQRMDFRGHDTPRPQAGQIRDRADMRQNDAPRRIAQRMSIGQSKPPKPREVLPARSRQARSDRAASRLALRCTGTARSPTWTAVAWSVSMQNVVPAVSGDTRRRAQVASAAAVVAWEVAACTWVAVDSIAGNVIQSKQRPVP